jgi:hypothetical protein
MAERVTEALKRDWLQRHAHKPASAYLFRLADTARIRWLCEASEISTVFRGIRRAVCAQLNERGCKCLCCQVELPGDPSAVAVLMCEGDLEELISAGICRSCCQVHGDRYIVDRMVAHFNGVVLGRADQIAANVHRAHGTKQ